MQKVCIYVMGGNLFCIIGYLGFDFEVNLDLDKVKFYFIFGFDWGVYMCVCIFMVGLNVEF